MVGAVPCATLSGEVSRKVTPHVGWRDIRLVLQNEGSVPNELHKHSEETMVLSSKRRIGLLMAVTGIFAITGSLAAADEQTMSGIFKGNGQEAKLAYVSAVKGEPLA